MTLDYLTTLIHGTIPSVLLLFITTKYKYIKTPFNIKFIIFNNIVYNITYDLITHFHQNLV